VTIINPVTVKY